MFVKCIQNNCGNSNWSKGREYEVDNNRLKLDSNFGWSWLPSSVKLDKFEFGGCEFQKMYLYDAIKDYIEELDETKTDIYTTEVANKLRKMCVRY